jgi:hypothetical protein
MPSVGACRKVRPWIDDIIHGQAPCIRIALLRSISSRHAPCPDLTERRNALFATIFDSSGLVPKSW